jgi:hypothetical protein
VAAFIDELSSPLEELMELLRWSASANAEAKKP